LAKKTEALVWVAKQETAGGGCKEVKELTKRMEDGRKIWGEKRASWCWV
jgi:hypothetical protein